MLGNCKGKGTIYKGAGRLRPGRRRWVQGVGRSAGPLWNSLLHSPVRLSEGPSTSCDRRALRARASYRGRELSRSRPPQHVCPPSLAVLGEQSPALALKHADSHTYFTVAPKHQAVEIFGTWRIS